MSYKKYSLLIICFFCFSYVSGQEKATRWSLAQCIEHATAGSLDAFKAKNLYLSSYWGYRSFKAQSLPTISFQFSPMQYTNSITQRYDYSQNIDVYRQQQTLSSSGGISISQRLDLTGGTFNLNTGLNYFRNFGESVFTQYSSTPVSLGYSQSLFGFNGFKWSKKIEPLKYEIAQKRFLYSREDIAGIVASHFFDLASAQAEYDMAVEDVSSADSLYIAGKERSRISTISQADLLTLELDKMNAENALERASIRYKDLVSFTIPIVDWGIFHSNSTGCWNESGISIPETRPSRWVRHALIYLLDLPRSWASIWAGL